MKLAISRFVLPIMAVFVLACSTPLTGQTQKINAYYYLDADTDDFELIRDRMETYFENRDKGRGSGYKQWKRWEYLMQNRLTADGKTTNYSVRNFMTSQKLKAPQTRSGASWTPVAPTSYTNGPSGYNPGLGRVNVVAFHPTDPNTIFAGTPS